MRSAGAERESHCELVAARLEAHEEHVRDVRGWNEKHERNGTEDVTERATSPTTQSRSGVTATLKPVDSSQAFRYAVGKTSGKR